MAGGENRRPRRGRGGHGGGPARAMLWLLPVACLGTAAVWGWLGLNELRERRAGDDYYANLAAAVAAVAGEADSAAGGAEVSGGGVLAGEVATGGAGISGGSAGLGMAGVGGTRATGGGTSAGETATDGTGISGGGAATGEAATGEAGASGGGASAGEAATGGSVDDDGAATDVARALGGGAAMGEAATGGMGASGGGAAMGEAATGGMGISGGGAATGETAIREAGASGGGASAGEAATGGAGASGGSAGHGMAAFGGAGVKLSGGTRPSAVDFDALLRRCPDAVCWISIDGTRVNYPVVQGEDNLYYLKHLPDGTANAAGSILMDAACDPLFGNDVTILHGHHMRSGAMFGSLDAYWEAAYAGAHPVIRLSTPDGDWDVDVFAACTVNGATFGYPTTFADEQAFDRFVAQLKAASAFDAGVSVAYGDRLLLLSTCAYSFADARFVVAGRIRQP